MYQESRVCSMIQSCVRADVEYGARSWIERVGEDFCVGSVTTLEVEEFDIT
jgi:hypothetical protein